MRTGCLFSSAGAPARSACGRERRRSGGFCARSSGCTSSRRPRLVEDAEKSSPLRLPVIDGASLSSQSVWPIISSSLRKPSFGHHLAHFFGDEEEVVDDVLGRALEALAQHRVLRGDAHRAGVQVALAHHDAARRDQRRGREAELVGAQQRADDDVAAGAQPPSTCSAMRERRPFSTSVWWVSARPISHGLPACLSEVSGEAPVPPS
jgi:hypothetical protein